MVRVLPRLQQNKRSPDEIRTLADTFLFLADIVEPDPTLNPTLRDPADQQVLSTFRVSNADYLVTGDKDLLSLAAEYPIVTPADFWHRPRLKALRAKYSELPCQHRRCLFLCLGPCRRRCLSGCHPAVICFFLCPSLGARSCS